MERYVKLSIKNVNIKYTTQKKNYLTMEHKSLTATSSFKQQKPIKTLQKKIPIPANKNIQNTHQNQSARYKTHNNSKEKVNEFLLSNIKNLKKIYNNRIINYAKKKNKPPSLDRQYKHELKQSSEMIEKMLEKIANLKALHNKQNMTFNYSIYEKTLPTNKNVNKKKNPISLNSRIISKQKYSYNPYNLYKENAKNLSADAKTVPKIKIKNERKHKSNIDTICSYDDGKKDDSLNKKRFSASYEIYHYDELLEFEVVKKDKRLKNQLCKLISENKKLKRIATSSKNGNFFIDTAKIEEEEENKIKTDEKSKIIEKEIKDKIEMQKIYAEQKIFKERRSKNILRHYIKKKENDIKNIIRIKFFEFYYKSKIESIITEKRTDEPLELTSNNKNNNTIWNKSKLLCKTLLNQNKIKSTNNENLNNVGQNLNIVNNIANNNEKIKEDNNNYNKNTIISDINIEIVPDSQITSNIPNSATERNQNDNNPIINQTATIQNNKINNNQNISLQIVINPENNVSNNQNENKENTKTSIISNNSFNNENKQTVNISNNNIDNDKNNNIINEVPTSENQAIPQVVSFDVNNAEETQKEKRLLKSRKLRKLLAAKEQGRKDTLKKYFIKFLINEIFTLNQLRALKGKHFKETEFLNMVEKEDKLKDKVKLANFLKKNVNIVRTESIRKEKEEERLKRNQLLLSLFSKKDQKITAILRSKLKEYNVRAKIESLAEYEVKPKLKKKKKKKKKKSNKKNDEDIEEKEKKDETENIDEKNEVNVEDIKS